MVGRMLKWRNDMCGVMNKEGIYLLERERRMAQRHTLARGLAPCATEE